MSDLPQISGTVQPESMQISDCLTSASREGISAIDEFETALRVLAKMAAGMQGEHSEVLGEMLTVAVVSSTETFWRRLLSDLAGVCPVTANNIRNEKLTLGAAMSYPRNVLTLALLERSLFSSRGVIEETLKKFLKFEVAGHPEMKGALAAFSRACLTRHAAAHWRGYLDSSGVRELELGDLDGASYRLLPTRVLVDRAFAACDYLVHLANQVLFEFTVRKWLDNSVITLDPSHDAEDLNWCSELLRIFGSTETCEPSSIDASSILVALRAKES